MLMSSKRQDHHNLKALIRSVKKTEVIFQNVHHRSGLIDSSRFMDASKSNDALLTVDMTSRVNKEINKIEIAGTASVQDYSEEN